MHSAGFAPPDEVEGVLWKANALVYEVVWDGTEVASSCSSRQGFAAGEDNSDDWVFFIFLFARFFDFFGWCLHFDFLDLLELVLESKLKFACVGYLNEWCCYRILVHPWLFATE